MEMPQQDQPDTRLAVFTVPGGEVAFTVSDDGETLWGTRGQIASAFGCTESNVTQHIQKIYADGELDRGATSKKSLLVQNEGGRNVKRPVDEYKIGRAS